MADVHRIYPAKEALEELGHTQTQLNALARALAQETLRQGPGEGNYDTMHGRVTKLETHMEYVRSDLSEIKSSLTAVAGSLDGLKQDIRDTKLAAQEARLEAISTKAHSAGKTTVITTVLGTGAAILGIVLAALAFGGDRFDGGLDAASIAERAASNALAAQAPKP